MKTLFYTQEKMEKSKTTCTRIKLDEDHMEYVKPKAALRGDIKEIF